MRILYRNREAWIDLCEEPEHAITPDEREALRLFTLALPNPPTEIPIGDDGVAECVLLKTGNWPQAGDGTSFAEYTVRIQGGESPLPWPPPTEEQKAPGRATLNHIRDAVNRALRDWESNDYAAVVQNLKEIEREAHDLIKPVSQLIKNYMR